ncbi:MAG: glycoside hydrolase family 2 protein, partial [Catenulispora sp.]
MHVTAPTGWTVRAVGTLSPDVPAQLVERVIPAAVPGCVHLDLLEAGLIPDPYLDRNEEQLGWIGRTDWRYEAVFVAGPDTDRSGAPDARVDLVALGLDTVAEVQVNGQVVATTKNMHRSYRIPVGHLLRPGPNKIAVTFAAPVPAAERFSAEIGPRPHVNAHPFNSIRKMACSYGWDWGPDLATSGIWRPLGFEVWDTARIAAVRPLVAVEEDGSGMLTAHVDVERAPGQDDDLDVTIAIANTQTTATVPAGASAAVVKVLVPDVRLWWPRGYGAQNRYKVRATLTSGPRELDSWSGRVGFRTVRLNTTPDADGTPFELSVNGVRVFARGVNWIPDDAFPSRVGRQRYSARLRQALEANVNLIRIWGGGIYESEDFYDLCDELGLLVWQDFLFACASYAEEEPLRGEVEAEVREAVTRLAPHPSLVLWNGCNENIWGHEDWGWKPDLGDLTWGWG